MSRMNIDTSLIGVLYARWEVMSERKQKRDVYVAIADPTRRKLLYLLAEADELPLYELTSEFQMGRTAISKHLAILKGADLVTVRKVGRETRYRINATPLQEIKNWVSFHENFSMEKVAHVKQKVSEE